MTTEEKRKYRTTKAFKDLRKRKLVDTYYHCEVCGIEHKGKSSKNLNVHHLNPTQSYGRETLDDLVVLCRRDHRLLEQLLRRKHFDIDDYCKNLADIFRRSEE